MVALAVSDQEPVSPQVDSQPGVQCATCRRGRGKGRRDWRPWLSQYEYLRGGALHEPPLDPADQPQPQHAQQGRAGRGDDIRM